MEDGELLLTARQFSLFGKSIYLSTEEKFTKDSDSVIAKIKESSTMFSQKMSITGRYDEAIADIRVSHNCEVELPYYKTL